MYGKKCKPNSMTRTIYSEMDLNAKVVQNIDGRTNRQAENRTPQLIATIKTVAWEIYKHAQ